MIRALCIALTLVLVWAPMSQAAGKVALVIGNADYTNAPLRNPVDDARDMAGVLQELGFEVISYTNATRGDFLRAIEDFAGRILSKMEDMGSRIIVLYCCETPVRGRCKCMPQA